MRSTNEIPQRRWTDDEDVVDYDDMIIILITTLIMEKIKECSNM